METVVIDDKSGFGESVNLHARARAYDSVRAVLSDDHNHERGIAGAQGVAATVLAESGGRRAGGNDRRAFPEARVGT
jgi:hypothetical protein